MNGSCKVIPRNNADEKIKQQAAAYEARIDSVLESIKGSKNIFQNQLQLSSSSSLEVKSTSQLEKVIQWTLNNAESISLVKRYLENKTNKVVVDNANVCIPASLVSTIDSLQLYDATGKLDSNQVARVWEISAGIVNQIVSIDARQLEEIKSKTSLLAKESIAISAQLDLKKHRLAQLKQQVEERKRLAWSQLDQARLDGLFAGVVAEETQLRDGVVLQDLLQELI